MTPYFNTGHTSVRETCNRQRHHQLCALQIWPLAPERLADHVRPGQDVPSLSQSLENGNSLLSEANFVRRRYFGLQGKTLTLFRENMSLKINSQNPNCLESW